MPTDPAVSDAASFTDFGLLSPVSIGHDSEVGDDEVLGALVAAEVALTRAWAAVGVAPQGAADSVSDALGWKGVGRPCVQHGVPLQRLAGEAAAGGNPVIPLVGELRSRVPEDVCAWVHRGATSQDMLDSALMLIAQRAATTTLDDLRATQAALVQFAANHRDEVAAARTLTQHAVPTTLGLRAAGWARGVARAILRLETATNELPAQLAGAGGTLASFVQIAGEEAARQLPVAFAAELGLAAPVAPGTRNGGRLPNSVTRWHR
ncbi:lyase family protein [Leucobacter coleopterorum]|uniref:lyase family protein n=1 Tax=Leucobacter coleopterorum TaxID=2714933 RepID=UPI00244DAB18|nr:lyase family protein [Leucobacter coleopterorum]